MQAIIIQTSWSEGIRCSVSIPLRNGETAFTRQLRLFRKAGVHDFIIASHTEDLNAFRAEAEQLSFSDCHFSFISVSNTISPLYMIRNHINSDKLFIADSKLVFDSDLLHAILKKDHSRCAIIDKKDTSSPVQAQLGMKKILKIGHKLDKIGCFSLFPLYCLDREAISLWTNTLVQEGNDYLAEETSLNKILSDLCFSPFFIENHFIKSLSGNSKKDTPFLEELQKRDFSSQISVREQASILQLPKLMQTFNIHTALLLHDISFMRLSIPEILRHLKISYIPVLIEGKPTEAQIIAAANIFREKKLDGIISIGSGEIIDTAKCIKLYVIERFNRQAVTVTFYSPIPHIAVPVGENVNTAYTTTACFIKEQQLFNLSQDCILPDAVLQDLNFSDYTPTTHIATVPDMDNITTTRKISTKQRILTFVRKKIKPHFPHIYRCASFFYYRCLFIFFSYEYSLDTQMVLFESANGKSCNCNPYAIYQAMLQDETYQNFSFVWALRNPKIYAYLKNNPRTIVVRHGSWSYIKKYTQAKYWVTNYNIPQYFYKGNDHIWIHTWHGKPIKRIGCDFNKNIRKGYNAREIHHNYTAAAKQLTYLLSPAPVFTKHMASAYNLFHLHKENIVIETGYPRNDFLFQYTETDVLRIKLNLKIPLDKKVILYTPTWRTTNTHPKLNRYIYKSHLNIEAFSRLLGSNYIILFRAHPYEAASIDFSGIENHVLNVCNYQDVNDLYIVSDLMISDYSGTIFDYANLCRPMVFYQYDQAEYINEQTGVYFDMDVLPGPIVYQEEELADTVKRTLKNFTYDKKYRSFNETFNKLDGPDCGQNTAHMLIPKASDKSKSQQRKEKIREELRNLSVRFTGFFRGIGLSNNPNTHIFASYKNKYKGQRCFMIGNGPSLSLDDLDKIKNEYSFCCNLIYKIFDLTEWRPSFYCITDLVFTKTIAHELAANISMPFFTTSRSYKALKVHPQNTIYVNYIRKDNYYVHGNMKQYYVPANATVMTFMIELAMYMGFKEIYLIGVDCSNGFTKQNSHFTEDYESADMLSIERKRASRIAKDKDLSLEEFGNYRIDRSMKAYTVLRKYADSHDIHIYNATRGGNLEVFKRVKLEHVLYNK